MARRARHVAAEGGRRVRRARPVRTAGAVGVAALAVVTGGVISTNGPAQAHCPEGSRVRLAAAPELSRLLADALAAGAAPGHCGGAVVEAQDPADVAATVEQGRTTPDVWVPDSSTWLSRLAVQGKDLPEASASLARSPVVLAVPAAAADPVRDGGRPGFEALLDPRSRLRLELLDPRRSSAGLGAALSLSAAVQERPDRRAALTALLRAPVRPSPDLPGLAAAAAGAARVAVPASEQAVRAHNVAHGSVQLVALYPARQTVLDYPYVVLTADPARRAAAAEVLATLRDGLTGTMLRDAGFRDEAGRAAAGPVELLGVDSAAVPGHAPSPAEVTTALRTYSAVNAPARLLTVLDVSGSMAAPVPGAAGATRLQLAQRAAAEGLGLYPDDTQVGLWVFSTDLTASTDHRELVPVTGLGRQPDGSTGRQRLARALATATPGGDTGLYDTALAAVRQARASWQAGRVNLVVLLSDGRNDDARGIALPALLRTLAAEQDPARPTPVVSIAYGPDGDASALAAISRATGGASYVAKDPASIRSVFLDAVGQRSCRPDCEPGPTG